MKGAQTKWEELETSMANGVKFAQIGADVTRAADYELHFSSQWPTVHVLKGGYFVNTIASGEVFYEHGLGFVPAFIPYTYDSTDGSYQIARTILAADERYIYFYSGGGGGGSGSAERHFGIFLFNINIENNFRAPQSNPTAAASADSAGYGLKLTDGIATVNSDNMQDYKVNTDGRAPLVHSVAFGVGTEAGSTSVLRNFSYTHDLPYNPMFIPFVESSSHPGQYVNISNFAGVSTVGETITLHDLSQTQRASIVVLKDPFDVSGNTVSVML